jgi:thiol:disulfide interchange protein DsbC
MQMRRIIAVVAALAAVLPSLWAADSKPEAAANPEATAAIRKALESRFAGTKVLDVQTSPIPGVYEVFLGDRIVYADAAGDHVIVGDLIETRSQLDITQTKMEQRSAIDYKALPFEKAIKIVKGNGSRQLAVFEDPDCPFCRKLEQELATLNDTTVYVFLFPIDQLHPQATLHSRQIWCSPDRAQAWRQWLLERKPLPEAQCKGDPIAELGKLGEKLYVDGTPTLFFPSGKRVGGAIPTAELQQHLLAEAGHAAPKGAAAAPAPAKDPQAR